MRYSKVNNVLFFEEWRDKPMPIEPPSVIWLQFYDEMGEPPGRIDEDITWCWEPIENYDVRYIRDKRYKGQLDKRCSSCSTNFDSRFWNIDKFLYCPHCGVKWNVKYKI